MRFISRLNLSFQSPDVEEQYMSIKKKTAFSDLLVTALIIFILTLLVIIPDDMDNGQLDMIIGSCTLGAIVLVLCFMKCFRGRLQSLTVLLLLIYNISRLLLIKFNHDVNHVMYFLQGYVFGILQVIIIGRIHRIINKFIIIILFLALRLSFLYAAVDATTLQAASIIRQVFVDMFLLYMFYSDEKTSREVYREFYQNEQELLQFKEFLSSNLPQSLVVLGNCIEDCLFFNKAFEEAFDLTNQEVDNDITPNSVLNEQARRGRVWEHLNQLTVDLATIRQIGDESPDQQLLNIKSGEALFGDYIKEVRERDLLSRHPLSLTARQNTPTDHKSYHITLKKVTWNRMDSIAVVLSDVTYQENLVALKVANSNKDKIIATISHELRTPIHGIIGFLEAARSRVENTEVLKTLSLCKDNAVLLLSFFNSLVDFHQISTGKLRLEPKKVCIRDALHSVIKLFEFTCVAKNISLEMKVSGSVPQWIITDEDRLKQILVNLLGNAVKFTSRGKITVEATQEGSDEDHIKISVEDTGVGIKEEDKRSLFKLYSADRAERDSVNKNGAGIGLTTSNSIALMLNGKTRGRGIEIESQPGVGSKFYFLILKDVSEALAEDEQGQEMNIYRNVRPSFRPQEDLRETERELVVVTDNQTKRTLYSNEGNKDEDSEFIMNSGEGYEEASNSKALASKLASYTSISTINLQNIGRLRTGDINTGMTSDTVRRFDGTNLNDLWGKKHCNQEINEFRESLEDAEGAKPVTFCNVDTNQEFNRKETLIVVDDNPFNLLVAKNLINAIGYEVETAIGGTEAIELTKRCYRDRLPIKLILMDCQMPIMDGYETTRALRTLMDNEEIPKTPIIAWSANNSDEDIKKCFESGMIGHMPKPTSRETILKELSKLEISD